MATGQSYRLALVVRSEPFSGRSARDQLDLALAAAALECELELYFLGPGLLQLLASHAPGRADLPRGSKGWRSLPTLAAVRAFAPPRALAAMCAGDEWLLEVRPMEISDMRARWQDCHQVLVV